MSLGLLCSKYYTQIETFYSPVNRKFNHFRLFINTLSIFLKTNLQKILEIKCLTYVFIILQSSPPYPQSM